MHRTCSWSQCPTHRGRLRVQLWKAYLAERREAVRGLPVTHRDVAALNNTYERALVTMHKMPRVWQDYLEFLVGQRVVTRARRTFDNALRALPITQHDRLWPQYLVCDRRDPSLALFELVHTHMLPVMRLGSG